MEKSPRLPAGIQLDRLFGLDAAKRLRDVLEADAAWYDARISARAEKAGRAILRPTLRAAECNALLTLPHLLERFTHQVRNKVLPRVRAEYGANIEALADFNAIRYPEGGHFSVHRDNTAGFERRLFTVVCYLNDDVSGGETRFPDLDLAIRPKAGMAITFPSEYRHASQPVIAGIKYVLVCWLVGPPPRKWI